MAASLRPLEPPVSATEVRDAQMELGGQLAERRKAVRLTQLELARRVLYSRSGIANIETGRQTAPMDFWRAADHEVNAAGVLVKAALNLVDVKRAFAVQSARQRAAANAPLSCADPDQCPCSVVVGHWTGRQTRALREALRLDIAGFAQVLNLPIVIVRRWERPPSRLPRLVEQVALDRVLARSAPDTRARFRLLATPGEDSRPAGP